jgi:hypothetical protein
MATAKQWSNRLGWDVGQAEVRDLGSKLRAFVSMRPLRSPSVFRGREITTERYQVCDFPLGTDPSACVELTRKYGLVCDENEYRRESRVYPFIDPVLARSVQDMLDRSTAETAEDAECMLSAGSLEAPCRTCPKQAVGCDNDCPD